MSLLQQMGESTQHRGPDNIGFYMSGNGKVGLVHNRLSIIDLSVAANQPMSDVSGKVHIVFNGEIYNFLRLRQELVQKGYSFKSSSDSEVLLYMYIEHGLDMLDKLNGMFAFAIYDERNEKLFLARDRVGIKPLYYSATDKGMVFGSELKPLIASGLLSGSLDPVAVNAFFTLGYIPFSMTIFDNCSKLMPGHYLYYDLKANSYETARYWQLPNVDDKEYREDELLEKLEYLLNDAVAMRMVSDVPIGCFLSGGVDSSLCSVLMAGNSSVPVKTFNIGFTEDKYNESAYAKIVADSIGSEHFEHTVKLDAIEALNHLVNNFDEPFADSSMIPTFFVSKVAKEHVTVVLSGDGGDELFGGYNWYSWMLSLNHAQNKFPPVNTPIRVFSQIAPFNFKGRNFLSQLGLSPVSQFINRIGFFKPNELSITSDPVFLDKFEAKLDSFEGDLLQKISRMDFNCYLPDDILTKVDRASMAVSLEARVPWLDHRLVEFAFSLPSTWKIRQSRKKYLPKRLAEKLLPRQLLLERKQGFSIPLASWMRGELGDWLAGLADQAEPYIDTGSVKKLLVELRAGKADHGSKLYSILMFALWKKNF